MSLYDDYLNAILEYAALYHDNALIEMNDDVFSYLSTLLSVEKDALIESYNKGVVAPRNFYSYTLFGNYVFQYMICGIRKKITFSTDYQNVIRIFNDYLTIVSFINCISANITTVLSMKSGRFCYEKTLETYSRNLNESKSLQFLELFKVKEFYDANKDYLSMIYLLVDYEIESFQNLLLFLNALVLLYDSDSLNERYKKVAEHLIDRFFTLFRNARIITCRINSLYHDLRVPYEERKLTDNTTLLHIFYCFPNTDVFSLRLDLPHKGVDFIHFNNATPGKTKCFLFTQNEYDELICRYPNMSDCFIQYSNVYALKERVNCPDNKEIIEIYNEICKRYDHNAVFSDCIDEKVVVEFFDILHYLLPDNCFSPVEIDSDYVNRFFNYAELMGYFGLTGLLFAIFDDKIYQPMLEIIVKKAIKLGYISQEEKNDYMSIDGINLIVLMAKEDAVNKFGSIE